MAVGEAGPYLGERCDRNGAGGERYRIELGGGIMEGSVVNECLGEESHV